MEEKVFHFPLKRTKNFSNGKRIMLNIAKKLMKNRKDRMILLTIL